MHVLFYVLIALVAFEILFTILLSWSAIKGAPFATTSKTKVHKMLTMANIKPNDLVYDLGCGDGRVLIIAAKHYNARAIGIEIDPFRYLWCKFRIRVLGLREKVKVIRGDFFKNSLNDADIIICYLMQSTNNKLQKKLQDELKAHAIVVSHKFKFPDLNLVNHDEELNLFTYKINS
jgi:SAM-dependent methyltransferase